MIVAVAAVPQASTGTSSSPAPYSSASAVALAPSLPSYQYNLTLESNATRTAVCAQTVRDCATSRCSIFSANVTTNFCNPVTMGWNCLCNNGALTRLQAPIVPVNSFDCRLRTTACLNACQDRLATPPVRNLPACQQACNYIIGSTCGTNDQVIPTYQVASINDRPTYYPNTLTGGVAAGITTPTRSSAPRTAWTALGATMGLIVGIGAIFA